MHKYKKPEKWTRKAILNVANMGKFSSDRSIQEYAKEIWELDNSAFSVINKG